MTNNQDRLMTKGEIAEHLGVSICDIQRWAQRFADWLDVCARSKDRTHDEDDIQIFTLINRLNSQIEDSVPFQQRMSSIERELKSSSMARGIRKKRAKEKDSRQVKRWQEVCPSLGACLRYVYEWLKPLRSCVDNIVDFGCRPMDFGTCFEPYALLWTLKAKRIVVIDKECEHIQDAKQWLKKTQERLSYFKDYPLEFVVGDMTGEIDVLDENAFDLSYCRDVLCYMYPNQRELQDSINTMARVVKPGGWVIAVEQKMGVEHESVPSETLSWEVPKRRPGSRPVDISHLFEGAGLVKVNLDNAPDCSYCYNKPNR